MDSKPIDIDEFWKKSQKGATASIRNLASKDDLTKKVCTKYKVFRISDDADRAALQDIWDKCLNVRTVIIFSEETNFSPTGEYRVALKWGELLDDGSSK